MCVCECACVSECVCERVSGGECMSLPVLLQLRHAYPFWVGQFDYITRSNGGKSCRCTS